MDLVHPDYGPVGASGMGIPIQFSRCYAEFDQPATRLGAANGEIYGQLLGMNEDEQAALRGAGVI